MNTLRLIELKFSLIATKDFKSIGFMGNKIRGAIRHSMYLLHCNKNEIGCKKCNHYKDCVYGDLFKNPGKTSEFSAFPSPFVINVPFRLKEIIKEEEKLEFSIIIFGDAIKWWKQVALSVIFIFKNSSGIFNNSFKLENIYSVYNKKLIYDGKVFLDEPYITVWTDDVVSQKDDEIIMVIQLLSPVIIKGEKEFEPDFTMFMDEVFHRIASIIDMYENNEFAVPYGLLNRKPKIQTELIRQNGSVCGIIFKGNYNRYLPYIDLASCLHIGKKGTYGYGSFEYKLI